MRRLLSLDATAALDDAQVGVKAARLAAARQAGFPVLPGVVVPTAEAVPALRAGQVALDARGVGAARRAVWACGLDEELTSELERSRIGSSLVVRSSTGLDDDGVFAGAFTSLDEVRPPEIATAILACWASVFAPGTHARLELAGVAATSVGVAVLVQPSLAPSLAGWLRWADGAVEIAWAPGSPGRLLGGWTPGRRVVVAADGNIGGDDVPHAQRPVVAELIEVARRAQADLGAGRMEWAAADGKIVILQLDRPSPSVSDVRSLTTPMELLRSGVYRRLAVNLIGRSGRLADELLVPWAAAASPITLRRNLIDPFSFGEARRRAAALGASVARQVGLPAAEIVGRLERLDPGLADRLDAVRIDGEAAQAVVAAVEAAASTLTRRGALEAPEQIWWQQADWVETALRSEPGAPAARWIGDRWSDLAGHVVVANGSTAWGWPAAEGRTCGRARVVRGSTDPGSRLRPRDVLVVERPLRAFAPLLWRASALVSRTGSPGAHLCEVARALRVPVVVSADVRVASGDLVAVDGATGEVAIWSPDRRDGADQEDVGPGGR